MIYDPNTGVYTIIGVTVDAPYTTKQYMQGPNAIYSRITEVLPWIYDTMKATSKGWQ